MRQASLTFRQSSPSKGTIVDFLRHRHPRKTAEAVVADIAKMTRGLPLRAITVDAVEAMLKRQTKPSFDMTMALIGTYGPEFLAVAYPGMLGWLNDANKQQERDALRRQLESMQERLADL